MKKLISFLIVIIFFVFSCKEKVPTEPQEEPTETLAEAMIGPSGGEIKTDEFSLIVPEGAFSETENIKLLLNEEDVPFSENKISNSFKIEGIPRNFTKDLILKIKYNKEPEGESYIALGSNEYIEEREEYIIMYDLLDVEISSGYLTSTIKPMTKETQQIKKAGDIPPIEYVELFGYGLFRMLTYKGKSVEIKYRAGLNDSKIILLGDYFDEAVKIFTDMSLTVESMFGQTNYDRIKIIITDQEKIRPITNFNMSYDMKRITPLNLSILINRYEEMFKNYRINMNEVVFNAVNEDFLSKVAGEGVYRFLRTIWLGVENNWFDWATIYWVSYKFYQNTTSWEEEFAKSPLLIHPFQGMEAGQQLFTWGLDEKLGRIYSKVVGGHAVGMNPFIKFIMENYNNDGKLLTNIFSEILNNNNNIPTDFLIKTISDPENIWWPHFIKEYLLGNIYKNTADDFLNKIPTSDEIYFTEDTDILKHYDRTYPDLSAKLCRIITSQEVKETGTLSFKIDPSGINLDYVKVLVFGVLNGKFVLLNEGTEFSVSNLQQYSTLVACVVNSGNEPPYTGTSNINLDISVKDEVKFDLDINWVNIYISLQADYQHYDGPQTTGYFDFINADYQKSGELVNNIFTVSWSKTFTPVTTTNIGSIEIQLDTTSNPGKYKITNFLINEIHSSVYSEDGDMRIRKKEIKGTGINLYSDSYEDKILKFDISGNKVCEYIDHVIFDDRVNDDWWHTLSNWFCDNHSYIRIEFEKK